MALTKQMTFGLVFAIALLDIAASLTFSRSRSSMPFVAPTAGEINGRRLPADTQFRLKANIGREKGTQLPTSWAKDSRLVLPDIDVRISDRTGADIISMPGANGPDPSLSSGAHGLELVGPLPSFVGINGKEFVELECGTWETVVRKGIDAGQLIFGFSCPNGASRNDASIPAGEIYLQFALWDHETLSARVKKQKVDDSWTQSLKQDRDRALEEMNETDNVLMKALKYREACAAIEKIRGTRMTSRVPQDVVHLGCGLDIAAVGTIWCKTEGMSHGSHALLGHCNIEMMEKIEL